MNGTALSDTSPKIRACVFASRPGVELNSVKDKKDAMSNNPEVSQLITTACRPLRTLPMLRSSFSTAGPSPHTDGLTSRDAPRILRGHFPRVWWLSRMCSSVPLCRSV